MYKKQAPATISTVSKVSMGMRFGGPEAEDELGVPALHFRFLMVAMEAPITAFCACFRRDMFADLALAIASFAYDWRTTASEPTGANIRIMCELSTFASFVLLVK